MARLLALLLVAMISTLPLCRAAEKPDILGFRIGMTLAEVTAEFAKRGVRTPYPGSMASFSYDDGIETFATPKRQLRFNPVIEGREIDFRFSQAPGEQKLIQIERSYPLPNPPSKQAMIETLVQKYGEPADHSKGHTMIVWAEPDLPRCWAPGAWKGDINYLDLRFPDMEHSEVVNAVLSKGEHDLDLKTCGYGVYATLSGGDTVHELKIVISDFGTWARDRTALQARLAELTAEATERRKEAAQLPKL